MKQLVLFVALLLAYSLSFAQETAIDAFLKAQPEIKSVEKIEGNDFFTSTYKIMVEQPLDHEHPRKRHFPATRFCCR